MASIVEEIHNTSETAAILDILPERANRYRVDDLVITYCNATWALQYRIEPGEAIGQSLEQFLSDDEPDEPESNQLVDRIDASLSAPINVTDAISVICPASIGTADTRTVGPNPTRLLAAADDAMYQVKHARSAARHTNRVD